MLTKILLQKTLKNLPETFTIDELFDRLLLLNKVETGLSQAKEGKVFTTKEAKEKLKKWIK